MKTTIQLTQASPAAYLSLEGEESGRPEGPGYRAAVDAITALSRTLRTALERMGRPVTGMGSLQRLYTMNREVQPVTWHWKLLIRVPSPVTTTVVEFAKHLTGTRLPILLLRAPRKRVVPRPAYALARSISSAA